MIKNNNNKKKKRQSSASPAWVCQEKKKKKNPGLSPSVSKHNKPTGHNNKQNLSNNLNAYTKLSCLLLPQREGKKKRRSSRCLQLSDKTYNYFLMLKWRMMMRNITKNNNFLKTKHKKKASFAVSNDGLYA